MAFLRIVLSLLVAVAPWFSTAAAQQASKDFSQLVLEVHYYPNEPPAYQSIPVSSRRGAWYARFGHVRGWSPPADSPGVTAVNILSEPAEDGLRVWVSVFLGQLHEQEKSVASYILHEGDKISVQELKQFGVEPFEIALVRLNSQQATAPGFTSKARSVEVVSLQPNFSTLPSYDIVVRNVSDRNVSALRIELFQAGRVRISTMPQGKEGTPLISPGGTYELNIRVALRATPAANGYEPAILPNQVIDISMAAFDDGSFEGDADAASAFTGFQKGRKIQLGRIVDLFRESLDSTSALETNLASLRTNVESLNLEPDSASIQELVGKFPRLDQNLARNRIAIGMKGMRDQVLNEIVEYQLRNRRSEFNSLRDWLGTSVSRYEAWRARL